MSDQIVPEIDRDENSQLDAKIRWAARYIQWEWPVFVLGHKKTPVKNCEMCDSQLPGYVPHPMEDCPCLMCHGFYAATLSLDRVCDMLRIRPNGMLAVRTGGMRGVGGGLLVIDAEATADPRDEDNLTGLDVLDDWEGWTGFELAWRATLRQRTASGGLHVVYRIPADVQVGSHNRVLPQVDVKANGGYVAVPDGTNDRHWRPYDPWGQWQVNLPVEAPADLLEWLQRTTGRTYRAGSGGVAVAARCSRRQTSSGRTSTEPPPVSVSRSSRCCHSDCSSGERCRTRCVRSVGDTGSDASSRREMSFAGTRWSTRSGGTR